ncbi:AfsR/SARP family transcriptional regulator [Streptomyces iconiensis]|uniref:AfsR/SARP family transcriptional regulator n=1 Tax=Streptomyces iconiensis TaxID=1384038 RepID=A0ABT6ZXT6_9ACTN|nr:AfsR/SARP family transcriptional regulator [Streptomyces iconiensis]MDJ1133614.1 AfsR/SARP family transcriptional regulator [Streptomyces iconiensis]
MDEPTHPRKPPGSSPGHRAPEQAEGEEEKAREPEYVFRVLGPLKSPLRNQGTPKLRALLGTLLLNANRTVSVGSLVETLWAGSPPPSAAANIQTYVSGIRKSLDLHTENGSRRLLTRTPGYVLRVRPGELDLPHFTELSAMGRAALARNEATRAAALFERAAKLWRGRPLEDIERLSTSFEAQVNALEEQHLSVLNDWTAARLELGQNDELILELRMMVHDWPLSERTWYHLMLALCRSGRVSAALAAYRQARETIVGETGIEPSETLRALHEAILTGSTPRLTEMGKVIAFHHSSVAG